MPLIPWCGPVPRPALTRFHLALLFWNQILTCTSLKRSAEAIWLRSVSERYFFAWNSLSSSSSCSLVKAVLLLRAFVELCSQAPSEFCVSSTSSSMSDPRTKRVEYTKWLFQISYKTIIFCFQVNEAIYQVNVLFGLQCETYTEIFLGDYRRRQYPYWLSIVRLICMRRFGSWFSEVGVFVIAECLMLDNFHISLLNI